MIPAIKAYYDNKAQVQRDEVMRSCGIAGQTHMLAARAIGYSLPEGSRPPRGGAD